VPDSGKRTSQSSIAHRREDGAEQTVLEHLIGTAELARDFAAPFKAGNLAYDSGLCHDLGKYSSDFQRRIRGANISVDHSTAGGQYLWEQSNNTFGKMAAYCIMGHHAGLPDGGLIGNASDGSTLHAKMERAVPDYSAYRQDFEQGGISLSRAFPKFMPEDGFSAAFLTRMVYSALVDADWLDTEAFMNKSGIVRGAFDSIASLQAKLQSHLEKKFPKEAPKTTLNSMRDVLLENCIQNAADPIGLYTLTAPTGSGKTLSNLAFALHHAKQNGHKRVIYVVPYNTIIEQNARVFEGILGADNVVQHHSGVQYATDENDPDYKKLLATENWDAPLIVTSSVRFFESLYANKPSVCRKLHSIASSVVILDEAQMIPLPHLIPCVRALVELVKHYNCTVVLATATQSSLNAYFQDYGLEPREMVNDPQEMYEFFRRVQFEELPEGLSYEELGERIAIHKQALCIVNTRKAAQAVVDLLGEGAFHLSTTMIPIHRTDMLSEIRTRLKEGRECHVVSTSMIEAGVDVDFPVVYREKAGLDSIIQAAGRCNREGKRKPEESKVFVFSMAGESVQAVQKLIAQNISAYEHVVRNCKQFNDIVSLESIRVYFEQLRYYIGKKGLDKNNAVGLFNDGVNTLSLPFKEVAKKFRLIEHNTRSVFIPYDAAEVLLTRFRNGERSRELFRAAQQYSVSLYDSDLSKLDELGAIEHIDEEVLVLQEQYYSERYGVSLSPEGGMALFG
jgi:CRISPR-associated endonuclease/helicase Cas3